MTQRLRWGVATAVATVALVGCGGGNSADPVSTQQQSPVELRTRVDRVGGYELQVNPSKRNVKYGPVPKERLGNRAPNPFVVPDDQPAPTGQLINAGGGMVDGVLGTFRIEINPDLTASVVFPRTAQAQGDLSLLGVNQFFTGDTIDIAGVARGANDTIDLTVTFIHPFDAPTSISQPGGRLDLHAFNLWAGVLVNGSESYFTGAVTTNTRAVTNADSYRRVSFDNPTTTSVVEGMITQRTGLTANVFPGKWIADQSPANTDPALDNYNPTSNGWQGSNLLTPTGYGVFPMGDSVTTTFTLDPAGNVGPVSFDMVVLADYIQPKVAKVNKLPDPLDPTLLQYIAPYCAGDLQQVSTDVPADLGVTGGSTTPGSVTVVDLDADTAAIGVPANWPDNSDLNLLPYPSGIQQIDISLPTGLTASVPTETGGTGIPSDPKLFDFIITNTLPVATGDYRGLARVIDEETTNLANEQYFNLGPSLLPAATPLALEAFAPIDITVGGIAPPDVDFFPEVDAGDPSFLWTGGAWRNSAADSLGGLAIDEVTGSQTFGETGPTVWGGASPANTFGVVSAFWGGTALGIGLGGRTAVFPVRPRSWIADGAFHSTAANGVCPAGAQTPYGYPWGAVATARAYGGYMDKTNGLGTPWADNYSMSIFVDDFHGFLLDDTWWGGPATNGQWSTSRCGATVLLQLMTFDTTFFPGEPVAQVAGTETSFTADIVDVDFVRPGPARTSISDDLVFLNGMKGSPVGTTLPTTLGAQQFTSIIDNATGAVFPDDVWGNYYWGLSASTTNAAAKFGTGVGQLNALTVTHMDVHPSMDRMYVADSGKDNIEIYSVLSMSETEWLNNDQKLTYLSLATAPGLVTDPQDVAITQNGYVVVLDRGGTGGQDRLLVFDEDLTMVLGSRDLLTEGDVLANGSAISICADRGTANINVGNTTNDPQTAFALQFDDVANADGGIFWYTLTITP